MNINFDNTDFKDCFILVSQGNLEEAIYKMENISYGEFGEIQRNTIKLLKGEEIDDFGWYSNEQNEQTKIQTVASWCNLAEAMYIGGIGDKVKDPVFDFIHLMIWDFSKEIEELVEDESSGAMGGLVWMDGAKLRLWASKMAILFHKEGLEDYRLDMLIVNATVTNTLNSKEHYLVGPAMMAVSNLHLERGDLQKSDSFCNAILEDFDWLVNDYYKTGKEINKNDRISLESLKNACENKLEMGVKSVELSLLMNKLQELV